MQTDFKIPALTLVLCVSMFNSGCRVDKRGDGDKENVPIATPFGGLSVKTGEAAVEGSVGLSVYPGATLIQKDKDNGAADVNMNFGGFHLGVKALSYRSADAPDRVRDFYRKDMARYGVVLLCQANRALGVPDHIQDGLTCDQNKGAHMHVDADASQEELKAGSRSHQHIVAIDSEGSGSKIALVALDLPGNLTGRTADTAQ